MSQENVNPRQRRTAEFQRTPIRGALEMLLGFDPVMAEAVMSLSEDQWRELVQRSESK